MKEIGSNAQAVLAAAQRQQSPAVDVRARVWEQVQARAAAGDLGPTLPETSAAAPLTTTKILAWVVAAAVGGGAVAALMLGDDADDAPQVAAVNGVADAEVEPRPEPEPAATRAAQPLPIVVPEIEAPVDDTAAPDEAAAPPEPSDTSRRRRSRSVTPKPPAPPKTETDAGSDLAEEVRLMRRARGALGSGDAHQALDLLREHARRFPKGVLAKERDVSMVTALCALGKTKAARQRADAFLKRNPKSPLADRVRRSCVAED